MIKKRVTALFMAAALTLAPINSVLAAENYGALEEVMEMIDEVYVGSKPDREGILDSALHGIAASLDGYSQYFTEDELMSFLFSMESETYVFGIVLDIDSKGNVYIKDVLEGSSAKSQGLLPKDRIIKVNEVDVSGMDSYYILDVLNRRTDGAASIEIMRNGAVIKKEIRKTELNYSMVEVKKLPDVYNGENTDVLSNLLDVRYVSIRIIGEGVSEELSKAISQMKKEGVNRIILDLRGNSGGYLDEAVEICKQLVPEGNIITKEDNLGNRTVIKSTLKASPFKNIIVLTDEETASAAEIITSALQDSGAKVVGSRTYGKGVGQSVYELGNSGYFKITTEKYYTRLGRELNINGIIPNIPVNYPEALYVRDYTDAQDIKEVKSILSFCGYPIGNTDHVLDNITKSSIQSFKKDNGLADNSELDSITKFALNQLLYDKARGYDLEIVTAVKLLIS